MKVAVYSLDRPTHACAVIRLLGPLRHAGCEVVWAVDAASRTPAGNLTAAKGADVIVIQRYFPALKTLATLNALCHEPVPIVYDIDDAFLDLPEHHPNYRAIRPHVPYIRRMLSKVDAICVSTDELRQNLMSYTSRPISVQANLLDWELFQAMPRPLSEPYTFLISGTPTHDRDWSLIEGPLQSILERYGDRANAVYFGSLPDRFKSHRLVRAIPFDDNYTAYAGTLKGLHVHAALVPLTKTPFNECKSNIKWLEYSAAGIVGVYSDVKPYSGSIRSGENGLLVGNLPDQWYAAMEDLLTYPENGIRMANTAREQVAKQFSLRAKATIYTSYYQDQARKFLCRWAPAALLLRSTRTWFA